MTTAEAILMCYYEAAADVCNKWYDAVDAVVYNTDCDYNDMDEEDIIILTSTTDCTIAFFKTVLSVIHKMYTFLNRVEVSGLDAEAYLEYTINDKIISNFTNVLNAIEHKAKFDPDKVQVLIADLLHEVHEKVYEGVEAQ